MKAGIFLSHSGQMPKTFPVKSYVHHGHVDSTTGRRIPAETLLQRGQRY